MQAEGQRFESVILHNRAGVLSGRSFYDMLEQARRQRPCAAFVLPRGPVKESVPAPYGAGRGNCELRAYGGCLGDVLTRVRLQDAGGEAYWVEASALGLVYRGSVFTRGQFAGRTVLEAEVQLAEGDPKELLQRAAGYDAKRLGAQPRGRNAGSMFKNPAEQPAWKLIDAVGLRGAVRGDAAISEKHCNFFVNYGNARAADVAWLVEEAERRVKDRFGVALEREVAFVGAW